MNKKNIPKNYLQAFFFGYSWKTPPPSKRSKMVDIPKSQTQPRKARNVVDASAADLSRWAAEDAKKSSKPKKDVTSDRVEPERQPRRSSAEAARPPEPKPPESPKRRQPSSSAGLLTNASSSEPFQSVKSSAIVHVKERLETRAAALDISDQRVFFKGRKIGWMASLDLIPTCKLSRSEDLAVRLQLKSTTGGFVGILGGDKVIDMTEVDQALKKCRLPVSGKPLSFEKRDRIKTALVTFHLYERCRTDGMSKTEAREYIEQLPIDDFV